MGSRIYPVASDRKCLECGEVIMLRDRRDKKKIYCTRGCASKAHRRWQAEMVEASKILCKQCGSRFKSYDKAVYCSYACANESKRKYYDRVCQTCGKHFQVNKIYEIKRGDHKYCSLECHKRKYNFVEVDFNEQSHETMYWLGFMFATVLSVEEACVILQADGPSLARFNEFVRGNMVPAKLMDGHRLTLYSRPFSRKMSLVGLRDDLYMEAPPMLEEFRMDFVRGFLDSPRGYLYRDGSDVVAALHGSDSKLMRWMADTTGGQLAYKDKEWIVVSRNLTSLCDGLPRNEEKWARLARPNVVG